MEKDIKATDIMIGNWFIGYDDKPFQWKGYHFGIIENEVECVTIDKLIKSPILLTGDVLLKCGAIPHTAKGAFIIDNIIIDADLGIAMLNCIDITPLLFRCKYLHQLQNLFKCLNQTELKVEL